MKINQAAVWRAEGFTSREHRPTFFWAKQLLTSMRDSASSNKEILFKLGKQPVSTESQICIVDICSVFVCVGGCVLNLFCHPGWLN